MEFRIRVYYLCRQQLLQSSYYVLLPFFCLYYYSSVNPAGCSPVCWKAAHGVKTSDHCFKENLVADLNYRNGDYNIRKSYKVTAGGVFDPICFSESACNHSDFGCMYSATQGGLCTEQLYGSPHFPSLLLKTLLDFPQTFQ